ncbi:MAG: hypothetical protein JXQ23_02180, partial [Clostridia bacterium]|nr:hypothetical protein [Clostridia bacterium]
MKNSFYFKDLLDHYLRCYDQLLASESDFPVNGSQKENDRNLLELKKLFLGWLDKGNHLADLESTGNKAVIKEKVLHFMINTLKIDSWACQILDQENYYEVSSQFITRAKEMLGESAFSEIFQALRNIWVMVALQIYMDVDVTLTDAMSAYSMLYPLTDNYLDNPSIS